MTPTPPAPPAPPIDPRPPQRRRRPMPTTLRPLRRIIPAQVVMPPPGGRRQVVREGRRTITRDLMSRLHRPTNVNPAPGRHKSPKTGIISAHLRTLQLTRLNTSSGRSRVACTVKCVWSARALRPGETPRLGKTRWPGSVGLEADAAATRSSLWHQRRGTDDARVIRPPLMPTRAWSCHLRHSECGFALRRAVAEWSRCAGARGGVRMTHPCGISIRTGLSGQPPAVHRLRTRRPAKCSARRSSIGRLSSAIPKARLGVIYAAT